MLERICPRCGRSSKEIRFVDDLCIDHALAQAISDVPKSAQIVQCPRCQRIITTHNLVEKKVRDPRYDRHRAAASREQWASPTPSRLRAMAARPFLKAGLKGEYDLKAEQFKGYFDSGQGHVPYTLDSKIEYKKQICPQCSRSASGYFEAIVQVRGQDPKRREAYVDKIARKLAKKTFIAKIEDLPEGSDIYVGSKEEVIRALAHLGLTYKRTTTLAGERRDTKRLYRDTFAVRV